MVRNGWFQGVDRVMSSLDGQWSRRTVTCVVKHAIERLTKEGIFKLKRLYYDRQSGNVSVVLTPDGCMDMELRFLLDRRDAWCFVYLLDVPLINPNYPELGREYMLNRLLEVLGIKPIGDFTHIEGDRYASFLQLIDLTSQVILERWPLINEALDKRHRMDTVRKMDRESTFFVARHELERLTNSGTFRIVDMRYDLGELHSARIVLESDANIDIIMDSRYGRVQTRLRLKDEPNYLLELSDIIKAFDAKPDEYWDTTISSTSSKIKRFWRQIVQAFDEDHRQETIKKIAQMKTKGQEGEQDRLDIRVPPGS